jgi:hypothetical protein
VIFGSGWDSRWVFLFQPLHCQRFKSLPRGGHGLLALMAASLNRILTQPKERFYLLALSTSDLERRIRAAREGPPESFFTDGFPLCLWRMNARILRSVSLLIARVPIPATCGSCLLRYPMPYPQRIGMSWDDSGRYCTMKAGTSWPASKTLLGVFGGGGGNRTLVHLYGIKHLKRSWSQAGPNAP